MEKKEDKKSEEEKDSKEIKKLEHKEEVKKSEAVEEKKENKKIEEINEEEFEEFFEDVEFNTGSPSLRKVNSSQGSTFNLERELAETPSPSKTEKEENKPFNYTASVGNGGEPKYQQYEASNFSGMLNKTDIESLGRNTFERRENWGAGFAQSSDAKSFETRNFEKYEAVKRTDINRLGREEERKEVKYKP